MLPKISKIPILFLSGLRDEIVPLVPSSRSIAPHANDFSPSHMTQLFDLCKTETKIWRTLPNGAHNDSVAEPGYFDHIHSFITEEVQTEKSG